MTAIVSSNNEITHQPCPYDECGSSDAFSYNLVTKVGKCHSCNRGYPGRDSKFEWAESTYPPPPPKIDLKQARVISGRHDGIRGLEEDVANCTTFSCSTVKAMNLSVTHSSTRTM